MTPDQERSVRNLRATLSVAETRGYASVYVPTADLRAALAELLRLDNAVAVVVVPREEAPRGEEG